jgi:hypothetical protein
MKWFSLSAILREVIKSSDVFLELSRMWEATSSRLVGEPQGQRKRKAGAC